MMQMTDEEQISNARPEEPEAPGDYNIAKRRSAEVPEDYITQKQLSAGMLPHNEKTTKSRRTSDASAAGGWDLGGVASRVRHASGGRMGPCVLEASEEVDDADSDPDEDEDEDADAEDIICLLYTSPSPRD